MLFTSLTFLWFFAAVWGLYWLLSDQRRLQNRLLLLASALFYGAWDWRFLGLIFGSAAIDFWIGLRLAHPSRTRRQRRALVTLSLCCNLGVLGLFKYYDFFIEGARALLSTAGFEAHDWTLRLVLPVGISFYTFQTLSYTLSLYRGEIEVERDGMDFATYVAFFPQLVAGPIVRAQDFLPQLKARRAWDWRDQAEGLELVAWGLFKKLVIADSLAPAVDGVFAASGEVGWAARLIAIYAFTIQIYCDFSGYTDIARGTARMLGFHFPRNFARPYFARDPQEFWRRWHISLSTWLRDYLYISLGGNRRGRARTQFNLAATMVLGGLWHGAAWNFVLWGAYQGLLLIGHRALSERLGGRPLIPGVLGACVSQLAFLHLVCFGWLLFRAQSLEQIVDFCTPTTAGLLAGLPLSEAVSTGLVIGGAGTVVLVLWDLVHGRRASDPTAITRFAALPRAALVVTLLTLASVFGRFVGNEFIYFQF